MTFGSPSRYSPLMVIEEEKEGDNDEVDDKDTEEGEITED